MEMRPITSTYRLQMRKEFGFEQAREIVAYLDELGISHAYASPYATATPGSTHGYDLADPQRLSPELGGESAFLAWTEALTERGMGHIVDFVPNHMSASTYNAWWSDVLENGCSSLYADAFDIEWPPQRGARFGKVLLAVLDALYAEVLEGGRLTLVRRGGAFFVGYEELLFPTDPQSSLGVILDATARIEMAEDDPRSRELGSIALALRHLPSRSSTTPAQRLERAHEKEVIKLRLAAVANDPVVARALDDAVRSTNHGPRACEYNELDRILSDQNYRLAFWHVASEEINYRRFFDVNGLVAIRMQVPFVFLATHRLLLQLIARGLVHGVRLDHTDGLYEPSKYFATLRQAIESALPEGGLEFWVVIEKILATGEHLPSRWNVDGTTGYEFLTCVSGLFVDGASEESFSTTYKKATHDTMSFSEHARESKREVMRSSLSSEVHFLARRLERVAAMSRKGRDFTLSMLRVAITETIAALPVYRTYVSADGSHSPADGFILEQATALASRLNPDVGWPVFEFLREVLLLKAGIGGDTSESGSIPLAMRFQQFTGSVMAKSVEDTALYRYFRLISLNEVGGNPEKFGSSISEFHALNRHRRTEWPRSMTVTSTHDTKRGEAVRARLAVLSELPEMWDALVQQWLGISAKYAGEVEGKRAPDEADQYLLFQTAVGALPMTGMDDDFRERVEPYAVKAAREGQRRTSWLSPSESYERALVEFVRALLRDEEFGASLWECVRRIAPSGASNGLAHVVVRVASPGIADTYQGSECWDLSLVDPDNRRLVDYGARSSALRAISEVPAHDLLKSYEDGRIKLHVLRAALHLRREWPRVFLDGDYQPIDAGEEIVAFVRQHVKGSILCAVTRLPWRVTRDRAKFAVGPVWGERRVAVPPGQWKDVLTGRSVVSADSGVGAASLFAELPVALLRKAS